MKLTVISWIHNYYRNNRDIPFSLPNFPKSTFLQSNSTTKILTLIQDTNPIPIRLYSFYDMSVFMCSPIKILNNSNTRTLRVHFHSHTIHVPYVCLPPPLQSLAMTNLHICNLSFRCRNGHRYVTFWKAFQHSMRLP